MSAFFLLTRAKVSYTAGCQDPGNRCTWSCYHHKILKKYFQNIYTVWNTYLYPHFKNDGK